jgi:nonsense-mediated mRNA decay protein 3
VTSSVYWREPFQALASVTDLVEFIVLDIEPSGATRGKHVLADAEVAPSTSFVSSTNSSSSNFGMDMDTDAHNGSLDTTYHTKTHLGGILQPGDTVLGYYLTRANFNSDAFESLDSSRIPDVILIKKSYPNRRKKNKQRNWKLKSIAKEAEDGAGMNEGNTGFGRGALGRRGGVDQKKVERDYELFLRDIEEDTEIRAAINLYKGSQPEKENADTQMAAPTSTGGARGKGKKQYAMDVDMGQQTNQSANDSSTTGEHDEPDFPEIKLDELLDDLEDLDINDEQETEQ